MTKSKKQYAAAQPQAPSEEFGRSIELAFSDHPWPASRADVLEHASRQRTFAKSDFARLKRIPHRDYHSVADLMDATRQAEMSMSAAQGPGPVATAEHNRRAMGETRVDTGMHSDQFDERTH
ncbi:hypothetical protein ABH926_008450 [Catenulispora sp. GP43]|uniref:DUF2795 domain-containing protein n=1 Tax=Catenulispora sp. GP43 TaxID=3156263 RepID=UPI00351613CC